MVEWVTVEIVKGIELLKPLATRTVVTVGNFDGVHRGHRALLERLVNEARARKVPAVAMIFNPHPSRILTPERPVLRLFDEEDQRRELASTGLDILIEEPFTPAFAQKTAGEFLEQWLVQRLQPELLVIGHDFSCGKGREGNAEFFQKNAVRFGYEIEVQPALKLGPQIVSSSLIRQSIQNGEVSLAHRLLGRLFYLRGVVQKGAGRGRQIGFPTVNIPFAGEMQPKKGVYIARVVFEGQAYPAVMNIGTNPTVSGDASIKVEAHILDNEESWYGREIAIEFVDFVREEKKFSGLEELVAQIGRDKEIARRFFEKR